MAEILRAENIYSGYDGRHVLRGVSFTVKDGDVMAVIGPNGSGKTTLVKSILGLLPIRAGRLRLFGRERLSGREKERLIAYIPQRMELDRTFPISLKEMLGLTVHAGPKDKYVDMLELRGLMTEKVGDLSGGQMQRALLAYAVIKEPSLLIMDEPASWIDAKGADCILCIIEEFKKKGIAMIIVSHDYSVLHSVCTDVLGLGPEGYFFEPSDSPLIAGKIVALFGTLHHGKHPVCPV